MIHFSNYTINFERQDNLVVLFIIIVTIYHHKVFDFRNRGKFPPLVPISHIFDSTFYTKQEMDEYLGNLRFEDLHFFPLTRSTTLVETQSTANTPTEVANTLYAKIDAPSTPSPNLHQSLSTKLTAHDQTIFHDHQLLFSQVPLLDYLQFIWYLKHNYFLINLKLPLLNLQLRLKQQQSNFPPWTFIWIRHLYWSFGQNFLFVILHQVQTLQNHSRVIHFNLKQIRELTQWIFHIISGSYFQIKLPLL